MGSPKCAVCSRPIDLRASVPIAFNPTDVTNEQVLDEYERAKEQEAAEPTRGMLRGIYQSAGAARLGHTHGKSAAEEPEDEVVALGRALFALGAESYARHPECMGTPGYEKWLERKLDEQRPKR